jgi:hypothetical protein
VLNLKVERTVLEFRNSQLFIHHFVSMFAQVQESFEIIPGDRGRKKIAQHGCEETMFKPQRRYLCPNQSADDTTKVTGKKMIQKDFSHLEYKRSEARHNIAAAVRSGENYYSLHARYTLFCGLLSSFFFF